MAVGARDARTAVEPARNGCRIRCRYCPPACWAPVFLTSTVELALARCRGIWLCRAYAKAMPVPLAVPTGAIASP